MGMAMGGAKGGAKQRMPPAPEQATRDITEEELWEFVTRWSLNSDAQEKLFGLTPGAVEIVLEKFAPPEGAAEVSGKFIMFANSIQRGPPPSGARSQAAHAAPGGASGSRATGAFDPLQAFVDYWGLNADAQSKLWTLPPDVQQQVMAGFAPAAAPGMTDFSGKFIMYASSMMRPMGGKGKGKAKSMDPLTAFCAHWGLNADAQNKLWTLPPHIQQKVIAEFAPAPAPGMGADFSGKFIMYAQSMLNPAKGKGKGKAMGGVKRSFDQMEGGWLF